MQGGFWGASGRAGWSLGGAFVGLFLIAVNRGQYDDLEDPPRRMLDDD